MKKKIKKFIVKNPTDWDQEQYDGLIKLPKSISQAQFGKKAVMVPVGILDLNHVAQALSRPVT